MGSRQGSSLAAEDLTIGIAGFQYEDLYTPEGLKRLDQVFNDELAQQSAELHREYQDYRECQGEGMEPPAISEVLVRVAPLVGDFVARIFGVSSEHRRQSEDIERELDTVFVFRSEIVSKLSKHFKGVDAGVWDSVAVQQALDLLIGVGFPELSEDEDLERHTAASAARLWSWANPGDDAADDTSEAVAGLRERLSTDQRTAQVFTAAIDCADDHEFIEALLEHVRRWCYLAQTDADLNERVSTWLSFKSPQKTDFTTLVPHDTETYDGFEVWKGSAAHRRRRDGFVLTDKRFNERQSLYEVDHCIYCHDRGRDSCATGMRNRKDDSFKINPLGVTGFICSTPKST